MGQSQSIEIEQSGPDALTIVSELLKHVDVGSTGIKRVSVQIDTTDTVSYVNGDEIEATEMNLAVPLDSTSNTGDESETDFATFQGESNAFIVAAALYQINGDDFVEIEAIQDVVADTADIESSDYSAALWDLSDRGLVDKKDHPSDGRKNVYRLSERGTLSVKQSLGS